jgi:hypothetical protein
MGKKAGLFAAVAALFVVIGVVTWFAISHMKRQEATGLASVPRDSLGVISINADRIRAFPPAQRLRQMVLAQPDVARNWGPVVAGCGFDPFDRVDTVTFAWDRSAFTTRGDMPGMSLVALGHVNATDAQRCLTAASRAGHGTPPNVVPLAPINGHPVITFLDPGDTMRPDEPRVAIVNNGVVLGTAAAVPRTVDVVDHRQPGADRNDLLRGALGALSGDLLVYGLLDVPTLLQSLPPEAMSAVQSLNVPGFAGAVAQLLSIQSAGAGIMRMGDGLRSALIVTYRTPAEATNAAAVSQQAIGLLRLGMMTELQREQQRFMQRVQETLPFDPTIAAQIMPVQAFFNLLNTVPDHIRIRADGQIARVELDLSGADVSVVENGIRAFAACEASFDRTRAQRWGSSPSP